MIGLLSIAGLMVEGERLCLPAGFDATVRILLQTPASEGRAEETGAEAAGEETGGAMSATVTMPHAFAGARRELVLEAAVVQTITYFVAGVAAFTVFDYPALIANTGLGANMRPLSDPMVLAGPLLQPIRGALFGSVFYLLRGPFVGSPNGWLVMWATLAAFGVVGTFASPVGSIEGAIYTVLPWSLHLRILPELLLQPFMLSYVLFEWVLHPEKKWLGRTLWTAFVVVVSLASFVLVTTTRG